jgi:acyl-CoA reductase-like NAD-dependent aldehyde dehydrogenase
MASREDVHKWLSAPAAIRKYSRQIYRSDQKNNGTMTIINPATEEIMQEVKEDTEDTVSEKHQQVRGGQPSWAAQPVEERVGIIAKFYDALETEKEALAGTLTAETGKPLQQSFNELNGARARIRFFLDNSVRWLAEEWVTTEGATREKIVYEPLGVIANISAWNYPYLVGVNVFIPALIGGNGVLYKPSEYSTLTGLHIQRLLHRCGIPENVFQVVTGKGAAGEWLLRLPLDGYFFTGSYRTGRYIAEKVAPKLVPCQLELGGKDPLYVMDDVEDIDKVAAAALEGVVYNNGQSCCAVERIYVQEGVYDAFVASYVEQAKNMVVGDPMAAGTDIGALSRPGQLEFLLDQVKDALAKGGRLLYGGQRVGKTGYFMEPAVLVDVDHRMKLMVEESFGPVVGIQKVKGDDEAAALMADTEYGLTAAVYSKSYERAERVMRQLNTGTVYWNCCDRVSAGLPWSGRKHSGLGMTLSYQGIRAFVRPKAYHIRG